MACPITSKRTPARIGSKPAKPSRVTADVVDPTFVEINDARVVAHVEGPKGTIDVPMQWTGEKSGEYRGSFTAADEGLYTARVEAGRGTTVLGTGVTQLRAAPGEAEYFDAGMNAARLERIADETGGRFYKAADGRVAGGGCPLLGPRRHDHRRARSLAHADRARADPPADVRGVGLSARGGAGVDRGRCGAELGGGGVSRLSPRALRRSGPRELTR